MEVFRLQIQKVRIISNNICYGPEPLPEDEVEQHLTISASGRVWFAGYKYANGFGKFKICRRQQFAIGKPVVKEILALFSQYINSNQLVCYATDIGSWEMVITDTEGKEYTFKGSLCGGMTVVDIDLTQFLREYLSINQLFVFDGCGQEEII
jgi:hypothetical protein